MIKIYIKKALRKVAHVGYHVLKKIYFFSVPRLARLFVGRVNQNLIVFDSPSYDDNMKVLAEYIAENKPECRVVCFVEEKNIAPKYENIKFIKRAYSSGSKRAYSIFAYYFALKAKYVLYTHSFKWAGKKNDGQIIVNLWHGSGYKSGEMATFEHNFDYMMVPGELFIKSKAEFFNCDKNKILTLGYARYDLYKTATTALYQKMIDVAKINLEKDKLVLWLPTFIPKEYLSIYEDPTPYLYSGIPLIENLAQMIDLDEFCQRNKVKIIVKKHHLRYSETPLDEHLEKLKNIIVLSDLEFKTFGIELYELLPLTSGLISDFSSVSVDYMLLDKPIAYIVKDLKDYRKSRGFVFENPLEYMPGHHVNDIEELKNFIEDVVAGKDKYRNLREEKMCIMHNKTDNYSKRIVEHLKI